jgi:hypothetical protein
MAPGRGVIREHRKRAPAGRGIARGAVDIPRIGPDPGLQLVEDPNDRVPMLGKHVVQTRARGRVGSPDKRSMNPHAMCGASEEDAWNDGATYPCDIRPPRPLGPSSGHASGG